MRAPLVIREIVRDLEARRALSALLVALNKPPAGMFEGLESLRARYRDALGSDAPVCGAYVNDPHDGTGFCDTCGNTESVHR